MEELRLTFSEIKEFLLPASSDQEVLRYVGPFFWVVTGVLVFLYGRALTSSPSLREPLRGVIFTAIMLVHGLLHWRLPRATGNTRVALIYLVFQGLLALALTVLSKNIIFPLALGAILIGETAGAVRKMRIAIPLIVMQLGLALISYISIMGWGDLPSWWFTALPITAFVILYVIMFNRQADASQQAQALLRELEEAHHKLADYSSHVEQLTRVAERERMARDLHDTLAQGVAGLVLQLEAVKNHLDNGRTERAGEIIDLSLQRARSTLTESRAAIDNLRRRAETLHLEELVRGHAAGFSHTAGIPCEVISTLSDPVILPAAAAEHIERIVSEALFNILRHAKASRVEIKIEQARQDIRLHIEDNGIGFDPTHSQSSGRYGLIGIRERARLLGGSSAIDSQPGKGTHLRLSFPAFTESKRYPHE
jgi:NarL family two-component system sensor histidine kinase YdfH